MTAANVLAAGVPLGDVVAVLDEQYPRWTAEEWDAVGAVCGRDSDRIDKVLFAVDPHPRVVAEAIEWGADLIITHHPLFLTPVHEVASGWRGAVIHDLVRARIGLFCAHTNADVAPGGVNDALADALGLGQVTTLDSRSAAARGFEPGFGLGRIGMLPTPCTLEAFAGDVVRRLPAAAGGIRVAGPLDCEVRTVAVCGGAGESLVAVAREMGADVYVTADLRHHRTADALSDGGPTLIDAGHWSTEWPWLPAAARRLVAALEDVGTTVETRVSTVVTDPWSHHRAFE